MSYQAELAFAKELARRSGEMMRATMGTTTSSWKLDASPVTETDIAINRAVLEAVQAQFPDDGILGEEESYEPERSRRWVVDPIDGTKLFAMSAPLAMFSLGLVVDGQPVVGVAYEPFMDTMFWAVRGEGAFLNDEKISVSDVASLDKQSVFVGSRMGGRHLTDAQAVTMCLKHGASPFIFRSTVYSLMRVACGAALASISGTGKPWDLAAACVILQEAGASLTDLDGQPLRYDQGDGFVVSNPKVHAQFIELLKSSAAA